MLANQGSFRLDKSDPKSQLPTVRLAHPMLLGGGNFTDVETFEGWEARHPEFQSASIKYKLARFFLPDYLLGWAGDLYLSRELSLPVGISNPLQSRVLHLSGPRQAEGEIVFKLQLPVINGLAPKDLLAIRESEHDAFEAFRSSLRMAIRERLSVGGSEPSNVAQEISQDVIQPALNNIERRLASAQSVLSRKHGLTSTLTAFGAVCGFMGHIELAGALFVASAVSAVDSEKKMVEDKATIESSDMYWLWKVKHEGHKNHNKRRRATRR